MAKVTGQSIPPSMAALFASSVTMSTPYTSTFAIARADEELMGLKPIETKNKLLIRARVAADWLTLKHASGMSETAKRDYRASRVTEIMAGNFSAEWWDVVPLIGQDVQLFTPLTEAAPNSIPIEWRDPDRQASRVNYYQVPDTYAKPADYTDGVQKSPGFYGSVQEGVFVDEWAAQLRYKYQINTPIGDGLQNPLWARIETSHVMSASFRGNRFWASVNFSPTPTTDFNSTLTKYNEWRGSIARENVRRLPLLPPQTPWAQTITQWHTVDLIHHTHLRRETIIDKFFLCASPSPPNGRYFSRNDWCRCWLFCTPTVYIAKE